MQCPGVMTIVFYFMDHLTGGVGGPLVSLDCDLRTVVWESNSGIGQVGALCCCPVHWSWNPGEAAHLAFLSLRLFI